MFAVATAQGRTGAATAEALLKQGQKVRALVRTEAQGERWHRRHAEVAVLDLTDTPALTKALTGVTGAYLTLPPNPAATDFLADRADFFGRVVAAVKAAKLERVVFLSCAGAQHPAGTGPTVALHRAEAALKGAAPCLTVLRAAPFVENWGAELLRALDTGDLRFYGATHHKFPQACAHDVGEAAAHALVDAHKGLKVVELAGKENWCADDVAVVFTNLLGRPVKAVSLPVEQAKAGLLADGASEEAATLGAEWYQAHARGLIAFAHPHGYVRGTTALFDALKPLAD